MVEQSGRLCAYCFGCFPRSQRGTTSTGLVRSMKLAARTSSFGACMDVAFTPSPIMAAAVTRDAMISFMIPSIKLASPLEHGLTTIAKCNRATGITESPVGKYAPDNIVICASSHRTMRPVPCSRTATALSGANGTRPAPLFQGPLYVRPVNRSRTRSSPEFTASKTRACVRTPRNCSLMPPRVACARARLSRSG